MNADFVISPETRTDWRRDKMGKSTLHQSTQMLVGLNAFEPGQAHPPHAHEGTDKLYVVLEGEGLFSLSGQEQVMKQGQLMVAPAGVPHGVKNVSDRRLLVLAVMAPSPRHG